MKVRTFKWRHALWLAIFLFSLLCQGQNAYSQWWKDTVWTKETDQANGFYMLKFSKNDSLIVGHGYEMDLFFDAKTGNEITRIPGNNEIYFFNNDLNFLRLNEDEKTIEIWDATTYKIIDSLESNNIQIGKLDIAKDEKTVIAVTEDGLGKWDLGTKRLNKSRGFNIPDKIESYFLVRKRFDNIKITNDLSKAIVSFNLVYSNKQEPNATSFSKIYDMIYDFTTLDTIGRFQENTGFTFRLSNTNKYIACRTFNNNNYGLEIYDFNTKQLLWQIPVNPSSLTGYEFSPDDKYLVTAPTIMIWDLEKKEKVYQYSSGSSNNIAISHDGKFIANSIGNYISNFFARWDGTSVKNETENQKTIFPNPTNNTITVSFELHFSVQLNYSIYSGTGQIIKTLIEEHSNPGTITKTFDVSDLPTGNYFLRIIGENISLSYKVIIVR
ncbi:MAG: hypothetical protein A2X64_06105 [Ignavibacteria bacterium GWF2_33_9]|nr:MAG: hypothetical protein A2X64_06105 [Ignavibacteria bacterium GWF2_33_9]